MSLLAQNSDDMQCLLNAVQEFVAWSGIPVNTTKTKLMVVDGIVANRTLLVRVAYKNTPLDITPETEAGVIWSSGSRRMGICRLLCNWSWTGPFELKRLFKVTLWDLNRR